MSLPEIFDADLLDWSLRIAASLVAGGLIGLNRDMHGKPTGVRLHGLVSLSSALLVMAAQQVSDPAGVTRVIQGIVGGIGFLGAGVIMHGSGAPRESETVVTSASQIVPHGRLAIHHLTTAASIWATAAFGVACGLALWRLSILAIIGTTLALIVGNAIDRRMFGRLGIEDLGGDPLE